MFLDCKSVHELQKAEILLFVYKIHHNWLYIEDFIFRDEGLYHLIYIFIFIVSY